jgi:MFS family permease
MDQNNKTGKMTLPSWLSLRDILCTILAAILGLVAGWIDLHVTEVMVTILALLAAGLLSGMIQPAAAWRWAVLIAIGLPVMAALAVITDMQTAEPVQSDFRITLVALVFALAGSYTGVFIRHIIQKSAGRGQ